MKMQTRTKFSLPGLAIGKAVGLVIDASEGMTFDHLSIGQASFGQVGARRVEKFDSRAARE
ncbi:hypothetical protein MasN3_23020 [Massilia varians]|uniref:Uncharacterized protein n=1 Tax=Massilia varians TaxID=457921 RepID=A0ABM8C6F6_9BURK|nr:hypothetical protein MasN3_23020 [Massilia varians]